MCKIDSMKSRGNYADEEEARNDKRGWTGSLRKRGGRMED